MRHFSAFSSQNVVVLFITSTIGKCIFFFNENKHENFVSFSKIIFEKKIVMSIGVPIKVLHEAEGHIITCETITGEVYRGKLIEAEDNMNCQMTQITVTYRDGRTGNLENVYIRGSKIRFLILPDMLKNAPMFKRQGPKAGTAGRGKSALLRAQSKCSIVTSVTAERELNICILQLLEVEEWVPELLSQSREQQVEVVEAHGKVLSCCFLENHMKFIRFGFSGGPTAGRGRGGL